MFLYCTSVSFCCLALTALCRYLGIKPGGKAISMLADADDRHGDRRSFRVFAEDQGQLSNGSAVQLQHAVSGLWLQMHGKQLVTQKKLDNTWWWLQLLPPDKATQVCILAALR